MIAGVDEVGRGALAGPVVSSAVVLPEKYSLIGLNDSKLLSPKKREELFDEIQNQAITIGIGIADEKEIDKTNILQATFTSMQRALGQCNQKPDKALIDGKPLPNQIIPNFHLDYPREVHTYLPTENDNNYHIHNNLHHNLL